MSRTPKDYGIWFKKVGFTDDGRLVSIYDNITEYRVGETTPMQRARVNHSGGWYAYPTISYAVNFNEADFDGPYAILAVRPHGHVVRYESGKAAFDRLDVLAMRPIKDFAPAQAAYNAAIAPAAAVYDAAVAPAREAYDAAIAAAWAAYDATVVPAREAYDAAVVSTQAACNVAYRALFANILEGVVP